MKGAYAVYAVTNFWEKMSPEIEMQQGKNMGELFLRCFGCSGTPPKDSFVNSMLTPQQPMPPKKLVFSTTSAPV
jgi:hypothetical protein